MSIAGAIVLLFGGMLAVMAVWNAAKPVRDPTQQYSPSWLAAMLVAELAPACLLVVSVIAIVGLALRGTTNIGGVAGLVLLAVSAVLLVYLIARAHMGARWLWPLIDGPVHPARGIARLIGVPIPTPIGLREERGIEYRPGCTLDLVVPAAPPSDARAFVYVHGGGWTGGDPQRQARDLYHALALDDWVVLAVRYPLAPAVTVDQQIAAVRDAIKWARHGLGDRGVAPKAVAVGGGSAGGLLAAMAALTPEDDSERVDAFVGVYGVYDMANRNRTRAAWAKVPEVVMQATFDEAPDRYRAVSPLDHIQGCTPPMLLVHGTHDTLVPIGESEQFADAVRAAGRPVDVVSIHGAQHAFDAVSSVTSRTAAAVIRDWLERTVPR